MHKETKTVLQFPVEPMGAVRMSQSDKWKIDPNARDPKRRQRPAVSRYFKYRDDLLFLATHYRFDIPDELTIRFFLSMPASWSHKKQREHDGQPHQQKPDIDNLCKAFLDALTTDDAHVWHIDATKYWTGKDGKIEVEV